MPSILSSSAETATMLLTTHHQCTHVQMGQQSRPLKVDGTTVIYNSIAPVEGSRILGDCDKSCHLMIYKQLGKAFTRPEDLCRSVLGMDSTHSRNPKATRIDMGEKQGNCTTLHTKTRWCVLKLEEFCVRTRTNLRRQCLHYQ